MVQGINKEYIFEQNWLKEKYLSYLLKQSEENNVKILAYCAMDNHIHILVYTEKLESLSKVMSHTNTKYGILYNKSMNRCGYVFRDRYRCENIYTISHLHNCVRYIHHNPVAANICESEGQYMYSTYNDFVNHKIPKEIIKLIYGDDPDYINKVKNGVRENVFIDVDNQFGVSKRVKQSKLLIRETLERYNGINNLHLLSKEQLYEIVKELINNPRVSKNQIMSVLHIGRKRLNRIIDDIKNDRKVSDE